jgi:Uma2 family endonuclease
MMTVAEFDQLPESPSCSYELRHGELFQVTRPVLKHVFVQKRLMELLDSAGGSGSALMEVGFRPLPEHELRVADVAYTSLQRWSEQDPAGHFQGVPDIVIEVLSPSNTAAEMLDKEQVCLENGGHEFWVVDIDRRQVKVSTPDGRTVAYKSGHEIPLLIGGTLVVDEIFRG